MGYPQRYITPATATPATDTLIRKGRTMLKGWYCYNLDAQAVFAHLYDAEAVGDVTPGVTVPKWTIAIPVNPTATNGSGANAGGFNITFELGMVIAVTKTLTGNVGAEVNTVLVNLETE